MEKKTKYDLPIGYFDFHKKQVYNFQYNRWHSVGFACYEDLLEISKRIKTFHDWKNVWIEHAEKAENEGRLKQAAIYYRAAEFYITQHDPDKIKLYDKFIALFYEVFKHDNLERFKIPYETSYLHVFKVPVKEGKKKGTILMHGGFDSFVEEFYYMMRIFSDNKYEVIAFEGPGQGGTRRKYNLSWDEHWEKPTQAILDHFNLSDVTIYGISMGGHLCLRAAAYEPRITKIVTSGGAIDYTKISNPLAQGLLSLFMHFPRFTTKAINNKMKKDEHHQWFMENAMYITNINNPLQAATKMLDMTRDNINPDRITQDVLVLTGKDDHFIPIKMHKMMMNAFPNAHSIKGIIYTKEQQAQNHCQIGNIPLVCHDVLTWLNHYHDI